MCNESQQIQTSWGERPHTRNFLHVNQCAAGNCSEALAADIAAASQPYVPSPANIGWEVWVGAIAGVIPFAIGSYQFVARIVSHGTVE